MIRFTQPGEREVDLVVGRYQWQRNIIGRAHPIDPEDIQIPVVDLAGVILLKLYAGGAQDAWDVEQLLALPPGVEILVTFDLPLTEKLSLGESLGLIGRQGYQRLLIEGEPVRLDEALAKLTGADGLTVVQDRVRVTEANRSRFAEACE